MNMVVISSSSEEEDVTNKNVTSPSSFSFSSLPDDLLECCLARISRSSYPSLSLVSKNFRSLVLSQRLKRIRTNLGNNEECVCVCLQLPNHSLVSWFSLWIKKTKQNLKMNKQNSNGNLLVPIPSPSYTPHVPILWLSVGSEIYTLGEIDTPSDVCVFHNGTWSKAPSMKMTRSRAMNVHALVLHEKIYVMGGCEKESTNWAEVFDTKTQTWESLPDPGERLRFSLIKRILSFDGKIYVIISAKEDMMKKHYVYNPEEGKWDTIGDTPLSKSICWIKNMMYTCDRSFCYWWDTDLELELEECRRIKGLNLLNGYDKVEITHLGGKLVIFFEDRVKLYDKKIWCAVIALERSSEDEVWGQIEWTDIVGIVPLRTTFLHSEIALF